MSSLIFHIDTEKKAGFELSNQKLLMEKIKVPEMLQINFSMTGPKGTNNLNRHIGMYCSNIFQVKRGKYYLYIGSIIHSSDGDNLHLTLRCAVF